LPRDDGEVSWIGWPGEGVLDVLENLQFHCERAFFDLVCGEDPQVAGEPEDGACGDEPFGRVVLVPPESVAVVGRELVVEVVVAFAHGEQCGEQVVPRAKPVVVCGAAQPMRDGVDGEGALRGELRGVGR
jgi:hypothetical protein